MDSLPTEVLRLALNGDALTNEDRAQAARTCRALHRAVEFRHIVLRSGGGGHDALERALASARGNARFRTT